MSVYIEAVQVSVPSNDNILPMTFQTRSAHGTYLHDHVGLGNPTPNHLIYSSDIHDGSTVGGTTIRNRVVTLRIGLDADTRADLEILRDKVFRLFSSNHELLLRTSRQDGTVRALYGYVQTGLEYSTQARIGSSEPMTVVIFCEDGISTGDMHEVDISGSVGAGTTWTIPFQIPFVIGQGEWEASHITHYSGTYKSFPCIDIHGPAEGFTLRNNTTGGVLVLSKRVGVGEVITADMNTLNVHDAAGVNRIDIVDINASRTDLMYLRHGNNAIAVNGTDFNTNSRAILTWHDRWLEIV